MVSTLEWVRVSLLSWEWRSESATGLHARRDPGLDGTMDLKTGVGWPEIPRFWIRETVQGALELGVWWEHQMVLQMPVAIETPPSKVESEDSSQSPSLFMAGED